MPDKGKFDLGSYVEVKDRLAVLYELFPQARVTTTYDLTSEPDEKPKVICRALVYRTPDDPIPVTGTSWMYLPGTTSYTRGSEVENCETSAIGRAIGIMGILIDRSIATSTEIDAKQVEPQRGDPSDGSLIGTADVAKAPHDYELRQGPEGNGIGFKLVEGRQNVRVIATGPLADALALVRDDVIGQRVVCFGRMTQEKWTMNKGKPNEHDVPYTRLALSRIETPSLVLPSPDEAPSLEMFSPDEDAALEAAMGI